MGGGAAFTGAGLAPFLGFFFSLPCALLPFPIADLGFVCVSSRATDPFILRGWGRLVLDRAVGRRASLERYGFVNPIDFHPGGRLRASSRHPHRRARRRGRGVRPGSRTGSKWRARGRTPGACWGSAPAGRCSGAGEVGIEVHGPHSVRSTRRLQRRDGHMQVPTAVDDITWAVQTPSGQGSAVGAVNRTPA